MSYVSSLYHIVFSTYCRKASINNDNRHNLYAVIANEIKKTKSKVLIINGMPDHIHILLNLHPTIALSTLIRTIKSSSSVWAKSSGLFPMFDGWEKEYGAFSISNSHKDAVYQYILNQQIHHQTVRGEDEYLKLIYKAGLTYYEGEIKS